MIVVVAQSPQVRLGNLLRDRRNSLGLSQIIVSDRAGIGQTTLSAWENGKVRNPSSVELTAVASVLGIDLTEWMHLPDMEDVAAYIRKLQNAQIQSGDFTGDRAEVVRILATLSDEGVGRVRRYTEALAEEEAALRKLPANVRM